MASKRKQIIEALSKNGLSTMDDLGFNTGIVRKSLHDNVKAAVQDGLVERRMDDITRHPAYLLTGKGRDWLVKNQANSFVLEEGEQPQPTVGQNIGSDGLGSRVAGGAILAVPLAKAVAVIEPPKPDDAPAAVRSDAMQVEASGTMAKLVENLNKTINQQGRQIVMFEEMIADFEQMAMNQVQTIKGLQAENDTLQIRVGVLEGNEELPLHHAMPDRYIITDSYVIVKTEAEANRAAMRIAQDIETDSPVVVFAPIQARELRINWRDA